jgi:ribonuclease HI
MSIFLIKFDGGANGNPGEGGSGCVVYREGKPVAELGIYHRNCTNNEAEYVGLIIGLQWMIENNLNHLPVKVQGDSMLVIKQMKKEYKVKAANLKEFYGTAVELASQFPHIEFEHIYREQNQAADRLSNEVRYIKENIIKSSI